MKKTLAKFTHRLAFGHQDAPEDGSAVPLTRAQPRTALQIVRVNDHGHEVQRLCEMGLTTGSTLLLIRRDGSSPLVVQVGDCRIGVNPELAKHFWVVACEGCQRRRHRHRGERGHRHRGGHGHGRHLKDGPAS